MNSLHRNISIMVILALVLTVLAGCPTSNRPLTNQDRATLAWSQYNSLATEYKLQYATMAPDGFTSDEKHYLDGYWNTLATAHKAIMAYDAVVTGGMNPTPDAEAALAQAIRDLANLSLNIKKR